MKPRTKNYYFHVLHVCMIYRLFLDSVIFFLQFLEVLDKIQNLNQKFIMFNEANRS